MTKDPLRLATALRQERGLQSQTEFAKQIGIGCATLSHYETGKSYPTGKRINTFAELLYWDDETRMYLMPELKKDMSELSKKFMAHTWYLNIPRKDIAKALDISLSSLRNFDKGIPMVHQDKVEEFLKMEAEDINRLLRKNEEREPLNIVLIDRVLKRYEHLDAHELPLDDPDVVSMRKNVGAE